MPTQTTIQNTKVTLFSNTKKNDAFKQRVAAFCDAYVELRENDKNTDTLLEQYYDVFSPTCKDTTFKKKLSAFCISYLRNRDPATLIPSIISNVNSVSPNNSLTNAAMEIYMANDRQKEKYLQFKSDVESKGNIFPCQQRDALLNKFVIIETKKNWALMDAINSKSETKQIKEIMEKYCIPIDMQIDTVRGRTPLLIALSSSGKGGIVEYFLERGANVNVKDWGNNTPLELATMNYDGSLVERLVKMGAKVTGRALRYSVYNSSESDEKDKFFILFNTLFKSNGMTFDEQYKSVLLEKTKDGDTILHVCMDYIIYDSNENQKKQLLNYMDLILKVCPELVNIKNNNGITPLQYMKDIAKHNATDEVIKTTFDNYIRTYEARELGEGQTKGGGSTKKTVSKRSKRM